MRVIGPVHSVLRLQAEMPGLAILGAMFSRWLTIALLVCGALVLIAAGFSAYDSETGLAFWPLAAAVSAERLLPLIGVGILLAQFGGRARIWAMILLGFGAIVGIKEREVYYLLLAPVPGAAGHSFLAGPVACVLVGLMLVLPRHRRAWLVLPFIAPAGAVMAIGLLLSDPTLHTAEYEAVVAVGAIWFMLCVGLAARLLDRPWLDIGSRVLGSWLVAIGLLFGGAHVASKRNDLSPPDFMAGPSEGEFPAFSGWIDDAGSGKP